MKNTKNRTFAIIGLIAAVNALGYGIIIPILFSYSQKFGLSVFQNGLLFAIFSLCAFLSAPLIGRLSDKYGRKPLLVISISGTAISFIMAAFAPSAIFLFIARAIDGITAGNIPVANAVITDITDFKDRAKGFGIIGGAFGFGFVFGPVISAVTSRWGLNVPFIIAACITVIAVIITTILLPETNTHLGEVQKGRIFDFKKMVTALFDANVGTTFLISLIYSFSWAMFIFAYQPVSVTLRHFDPSQIALIFTLIGVIGVVCQMFIVPKTVKKFGEKRSFTVALSTIGLIFTLLYFTNNNTVFIALVLIMAFANSFINTLVTTILSLETDAKSQGSILGLNASYASIGNIFGPIIGGIVSTVNMPMPFLIAGILGFVCTFLGTKVLRKDVPVESAF